MYANNETGVVQPVPEIGRLCHERGVLFHTDATQAAGHMPTDVNSDNIDLLSVSAHKLYGPKGVGCLYVRKRNPRVLLTPLFDGGGHERGFRSGTLNVPGIVGLGEACRIAMDAMPMEMRRMAELRDRLETGILAANRFITINGDRANRLPHTTNMSFAYAEGESIMLAMEEIAVSSGSACTSASLEPSHVLAAMGVSPVLAHSSIRFGVGRSTTAEQIDYVIRKVTSSLQRLREMSPLYELAMEGIDPAAIRWAPTEHQAGQSAASGQ
jgi:cysteine desulfurase